MAQQSNTYKKFVATAATATLVASAIVPVASADVKVAASDFTDVSESYKAAVEYLVSVGAKGVTATQFGISHDIKRADAAILIASALGILDENAPASGFTDVPARAAVAVNSLKAAGIVNGKTATKFGVDDALKRGEVALILANANAYNLKGDASKLEFTDVKAVYAPAVAGMVEAKVTSGISKTQYGTDNSIKRGDLAKFLFGLKDKVEEEIGEVEVASVTAINEKTLTVTGTGLTGLKAEDITLAGNEVVSVTAAAGGKTAKVVFKENFLNNVEQTVKVTQDDVAKEFKFTYKVAEVDVKKIKLDANIYDNDTEGQVLTFKVDGLSADASADFLREAGYTVNFVAVDEDNAKAAIFSNTTHESTTGILGSPNKLGEYSVELQLIKDGEIVVSNTATITIADLETTVTSLDSLKLQIEDASNNLLTLNSTTLVAGEDATITKVVGKAAGKSDVSIPLSIVEVSSSNKAVISVNDGVVSANAPGKADITIKVGSVTKTITMTVAEKAREVAKVTAAPAVTKIFLGSDRAIKVASLDQYGDPIAYEDADITEVYPEAVGAVDAIVTGAPFVPNAANASKGTITLTADEVGKGTLAFQNAAMKNLGTIKLEVSDVNEAGSTAVEELSGTGNSYEVNGEGTYQVAEFTKAGFFTGVVEVVNATPTADQYIVSVADPTVATIDVTNPDAFVVTAEKEGSTSIILKDASGVVKHTFKITVKDPVSVITKVNYKAAKTITARDVEITYATILDARIDIAGKDPVVYGIEHSSLHSDKVRISDAGEIYIDTDTEANHATALAGTYDGDDILLGNITAKELAGGTFGGTVADLSNLELGGTNFETTAGDKGSILFTIKDASDTKIISTTTIDVLVK